MNAEIQADGDELNFILNNIDNLPNIPKLKVQTWYGDHAKFIANYVISKNMGA